MRKLATRCVLGSAIALLAGCATSHAPPPPPPTNTVALAWTSVTTLTDHAPLDDLSAYVLTYGPAGSSAGQVQKMEPKTVTALSLSLAPGTWQFSVAAISASHGTGLQSNIVTKTVQ